MGLYDMPGMLGASSQDIYGAGGEQDELSAMPQVDGGTQYDVASPYGLPRKKKSVASQMALPLMLGAMAGLGGKAGVGAAAPIALLVQALMNSQKKSAGSQQPWNEKPPVAGNSGSSSAGILGILGKLFGGQ